MRTMYDDIASGVANIPADAQLVAGYDDGAYAWSPADWARFPNAIHVHIAVFATTNSGTVGDRETGDMTEASLVDWVLMRRAAGVDPTGYCNETNWQPCKDAFAARGVPEPHWWVASYPGAGATIPAGAVAHQYGSIPSGADISVVADYWPGVDPQGADMPNRTDVVDTWVVPGTNGAVYCDLHADGGLFTYGGLDPNQLNYVAVSNLPENRYHFGPGITPGVISYPGIPGEVDRFPTRYFVRMHVYAYAGVTYDPPPAAPADNDQKIIDALHAAGSALTGI